MAIADTINEINSIIDDLKAIADAGDTLDGAAKTTMETRIAHLRNKTRPNPVITLTDDLTDLTDKAIIGETPATGAKKVVVGLGFRYLGEV